MREFSNFEKQKMQKLWEFQIKSKNSDVFINCLVAEIWKMMENSNFCISICTNTKSEGIFKFMKISKSKNSDISINSFNWWNLENEGKFKFLHK